MQSGKLEIIASRVAMAAISLMMLGNTLCMAQVPDTNPVPDQNPVAAPQPVPAAAQPRTRVVCPTPEELEQQYRKLSEIEVKLAPMEGATPIDCSEELFASSTEGAVAGRLSRSWGQIDYVWQPTELAHQPLYFDDVPLERYGQTINPLLQPVFSGARFFGTFPVVPYKIGLNGPWERVTTLGYYRPGSPAPCVKQSLPLKLDAAAIESGAWVGLIFLLP